GVTQSMQGEKAKSIVTLEKSLSQLEKVPIQDEDTIPLVHKILGENYTVQNEPRKAIDHFEAYLALNRELIKKEQDPEKLKTLKGFQASVLTNVTSVYLLSGLKSFALNSARESAQIYTEIGKDFEALSAHFLEARVLVESGELQTAVEVYQ